MKKRKKTTNVGVGVKKSEPLYVAGGKVNGAAAVEGPPYCFL